MKGKFTKIMAALALLVGLTIPMGMWGQTRAEGDTHEFEQSLEQLLNNNASIPSITIPVQSYSVKKVTISYRYNKTIQNAVTMEVKVGGTSWGTKYSTGTGSNYTTVDFEGTSATGAIVISFTNNTGSGTGHGTFYVNNVTLTEGPGGSFPTTYTVTYNANGGTGTMTDPNSPYEEGDEVTLLDNTFVAPEGMMWDSWLVKDAGNNTISVTNNHFTMPASNVTVTAQWVEDSNEYEWALTDLADLTSSDVFVIVGNISNTNYTMTNDNGTSSAPTAATVTIANDRITSEIANNIKWNVSGNATDGYTFYPNGTTETWLYCNTTAQSSSNNNMRVGTGDRKVFSYSNDYLETKDTYTKRYVCVYATGPDWRGYTSSSTKISFYKRQVVSTDPAIYASNVNIAYNDLEGQIEYILENEVTGGELTATTTSDWLTLPQTFASPITFTATENTMTQARTATVTLTYTYGNNQSISKDVTVTQGAHPVTYTTIEAMFDAAGNTATEVFVTFGGWVISGVSTNGYNVFVTDGTNGFVINGGDHGFEVGNTLTSTTPITCTLQKSNGYAKVTGVNASTEGLTVGTGGTVTEADIEMANLTGINTGALVSYENLTSSIDGNKYYLTDGTTTLQVYTSLYDFTTNSELTAGNTYNITGVYQQYNDTKEILPRSAEDIVEVQVQHDEYTLTVGNPDHITFTVNYDEEVLENGETAEVQDGTEIAFTVNVENGYELENVTVEGANQEIVSYSETDGVYTFDMPAFDVTINAMAVSLTGDQYELYTGAIVEGDYLIVYDGGAMNTTVENDRLQYEAVTATNNVIVTDNAEIVWHIAPNGEYWTIYNADADAYAASTGAKNKAQMLADGADDMALWTVSGTETYDFVNKKNTANEVNANLRKNGTYGFACYAASTGGALSLYKKVEAASETYTLFIPGYSNATNPNGGYYLIASPVTVDPEDIEGMPEFYEGDPQGMTDGNFDLYYFDQAEEDEWRNYETQSFNLVPGKGYLYAHDTDVALTFTGTPYNGNGVFPLSYTEGASLAGWNLMGNPYNYNVTVDKEFYIMNEDGDEIITPEGTMPILPMQGFFVVATAAGQTVTFSEYETPVVPLDKLVMNLSQDRGTVIDRAIVRFGEGEQLPKFQLFENNTKLYIPQGNSDYAIVRSAAEGEMPVNFKAKENGTYTISVNTENVEMDYLHLIDNMTGANVDLLQTPSYTFEATTRDYASRFRLVFSANNNAEGNANFAYFNGSEWQISNIGEATLQVVDVMGRIVKNVALDGNATVSINEMPGVYMMRLLNGNDVKVQKVVIR